MNPIRTAMLHNLRSQRNRYLAAHGMRATLAHEINGRESDEQESVYAPDWNDEPREDFGE